MLALRPSCECCDKDLPPEAADAMICTFECTFCRECAEGKLAGRCPNCGGNFAPAPFAPPISLRNIRPRRRACSSRKAAGRRLKAKAMNDEIDREDMNRKLVKMTSDEFATGLNKAFRQTVQEWYNRDVVLMALIVLWVIGRTLYLWFDPL